jgi:SAM-dependent methyltransferase
VAVVATPQHDHGPVHLDEADWREFAAQTELEGEVLIRFVTDTAEQVKARRDPEGPPVRRILDIGSGPGVGACELARLFPEAQVVAIDGSPAMLARAADRAEKHGLGAQVTTRLAELPGGLDSLEPADLIWASMSLHHVGDEVGLLRVLGALLDPQGVIAVAELAEPMRVLPEVLDVGLPGLSERLDRAAATWFAAMREGLTDAAPSTDLPSMLTSAGLEVLSAQGARESLDPPLSAVARRMVCGHLRRTRRHLNELLDDEDLEAIDILSDPDDRRGVMHRSDVFVAASREIAIARRVRE